MNTEPEETAEENPEKQIEIERIPEPMFPGTRERLSVVHRDEPAPMIRATREGVRIKQASTKVNSNGTIARASDFDKAYC
jgi:hypothetical protein